MSAKHDNKNKKNNKKQNNVPQTEENDVYSSNPYELKTEAVKKLVEANPENVPEVSEETIKKYRSGFLYRLPIWVKALFLKFWFNGAVCFFFYWGLGIYIKDFFDQMLVLVLAMGIVTDVLLNNILRFLSDKFNDYTPWMMFPMRKYWTFFTNILYAAVVILCVVLTYHGLNQLAIIGGGDADKVALGVEPILFGILYLMFDLLFIWMKNTAVKIIKDAMEKAKNN